LDSAVERHFDVLVLGGGTAGCVLAARLSEEPGLRVGLLEAGPDYGPYDAGGWPDDLLDARGLALDSHCWETDRDDRSQLRARVIGGCSSHNACVLLRGTDADYDEWGDGWRADDLRPYLDRAEEELALRTVERDDLSPWHSAFAEAAGDATIFHVVNARGPIRWNAAFAYLDPARARPNLTIFPDTLVDRVTFAGSKATGVTTSHGPFSAERIVVTASTYGSPAILLRSGLGSPVGDGLVDHVGVGSELGADRGVAHRGRGLGADARDVHGADHDPRRRRDVPVPCARPRLRDQLRRVPDEAAVPRLRPAALS
jgi:choline dehydrogenase